MNTVDALKDLYKTLCGKDYAGDPNPTDAEMISAIAKDASTGGGGGGSGSGGARIIDFSTLEPRQEVDPEDDEKIINYFSGYEAGLSAEDFINSWIVTVTNPDRRVLMPVGVVQDQYNHPETGGTRVAIVYHTTDTTYFYNPENGEFYFVQQASGK